ncbi:MAG: hypothetical protein KC613_28150, partial [Myxococcales bacterium]|nr:hypothetical protein [Myxococcales bacterium]
NLFIDVSDNRIDVYNGRVEGRARFDQVGAVQVNIWDLQGGIDVSALVEIDEANSLDISAIAMFGMPEE